MELYYIGDSSGNSEEDGRDRKLVASQGSTSETDCYPMALHSVCDALRKAGRVAELGHFMSLHSDR